MKDGANPMKERVLRILHLEDDPHDVDLVGGWLEDEGLACEIKNVQTAAEFEAALERGQVDLIISDYALPMFNGLEALGMAHERLPNVPFILFSGTIGEEVAVQSLKQGATDYVLKQRPQRLIAAVRHALSKAEELAKRKKAERQLREQAALLDKAQDAIVVCDMEGEITYWNRSAERIYGWKEGEAIAQSVDRILGGSAAQLERAMISLKERGEWVGELCQIRRDGSEIVVESRWTLVREHGDKDQARLMINTDITERKKLEAQFLRAQRLESIGALAGGIAHDLNNIFTPILMGTEMLGEEIDANDRRKMVATLKGCAQRGSEMVKQILSFARGVGGQTGPLDLNAVVNEMVRFVKETFPRTVQLEVNVEPDLPQVVGNSTQLHQILLNLCVNARDAMPNGGRIELTAKKELLKAYVVRRQPQPVSGVYVILSVSDTGSGISPAVLDRIFEPFFTTKSAGKGTGLGLSTVMSIAKSHGGFVEVSSTVGKGTTFQVYLPGVQSPSSLIQLEKTAELTGHGEQILVVDDEIAFLQMTRESLEAFNYKVLVAHNGAEAVAAYQQHQKEIHAVITDMKMPVMDGPASIDALLQINPAVKIIGLSGFGSEPAATRAARLKVRSFLKKPYETSELLSSVAEVLNGHRS